MTSFEDDIDDSPDLGTEPESENESELDERSDTSLEEVGLRQIAPRQRVRQLWRNFVNRFVKGLADHEFIRSVGSPVIIPSYVVFNHLCRRLRVIDLVDADFLTEAQTRLWSFMWGDDRQAGYLASLSPEELSVACKILSDHEDLPVTLAAVDDAWWHVWDNDRDVSDLKSVWRHFLESSLWEPKPEALQSATKAAFHHYESAEQLFNNLYSLAAHLEEGELIRSLAECLGTSAFDIKQVRDTVMRAGRLSDCTLLRVDGLELSTKLAREALALWHQMEPGADYLRIHGDNTTAVFDFELDDGFFFDRRSGAEVALKLEQKPASVWEKHLEALLGAA
jgi:hypothetical protein